MSSEKSEPPRPRRASFRSLGFRLGAWYATALLVSLAVLGALAVYTVRRTVTRGDEVVIHERLERHRIVLGRIGLPAFKAAIDEATALEGDHGPVRVRDAHGRTLYQHGDVRHDTAIVSATVSSDLHLEVASTGGRWDAVGPPLEVAIVCVLVGCLLMGIAGGAVLTRRALRPVGALAETARAVIQSGDLSRRVDMSGSGSSELDQVAVLVNRMLERNQALVGSMREVLDNVAHDLRTPLARLRGTAEMALRADDPAQSPEALADCIEECDRALVMLRTLMDVSEAEAGIMRLERSAVELRALAAQTIDLYEQVAADAGVVLTLLAGPPVTVDGDPNRIRQALSNVIDNAIKYTPRGGHVAVSVEIDQAQREARLVVRDDGPGIPAHAIPRIWDRLYRVDPSRAQRGLGLGLSLVKAIAVAHGGRVSVDSAPGRGSVFAIALPLSPHTAPTG